MHEIGYYSDSSIERNEGIFNQECLLKAQEQSWLALDKISKEIHPGMNEYDAVKLVADLLGEHGSERSWHWPVVRFGENTAKPYNVGPDKYKILQPNDIYYIDIGPVWKGSDGTEYEGDVGDTFVLGRNLEFVNCRAAALSLFNRAADFWRQNGASGAEIYKWLEVEAAKMNYQIVPEDDGHRIGSFPHKRIFSEGLSLVRMRPSSNLWVLEVHVKDPQDRFGAFFEDILR